MSEVDNFESLSNADLRAKCKEHGLPNVPVTDTSRTVLIKKLRASLSGASPAAGTKKTNRRETVHVASKVYPSIDAVKAAVGNNEVSGGGSIRVGSPSRAANRRTIAATQSFSVGGKTAAADEPPMAATQPYPTVTVNRRTVREFQKTAVMENNVPSIILESDDEEDDIIVEAARRVERSNVQQRHKADAVDADTFVRPRTSRSVSLSKTGVLTTSYLQDIAPLPPVIADDEESDNSLAPENVRNKTRYTSNYSQSLASRPIASASVAAAAAPPASTLFNAPSTLFSSQPQSNRYTIGSTTTSSRFGIQSQPVTSYFSPSSQSTMRNVTTTSGYATKSTPHGESAYRGEQSDDTDTNNEDEAYNTPYLSNFARTLDRMKAEPLGGGGGFYSTNDTPEITRRYKATKATTYQTPGRRPRIGSDANDVTMRDILLALEQKYHLKRNFVILLIVLLFVFLFVLFWQ